MVETLVAGIAGAEGTNVATAANAAAMETENNYLGKTEIQALVAAWKNCTTTQCQKELISQYRKISEQHDKELAACTTFECVAGHLAAIREADSALATAYTADATGQLGVVVNNWQSKAQTVIAPTTASQNNLITSRKAELVLYMNQFCRGMSANQCATQMLQNEATAKAFSELAYMAAMLTPAGTVDDAKTLVTGKDLTGEDSSRLLAMFGVLTAGEGTGIKKVVERVVEDAGGLVKLAKAAVKDSPEAAKLTQELEAANKTGLSDLAQKMSSRSDVDQVFEVGAGSKGNWDKAINGQLEPKAAYVLDNGHAYVTDASGRVSEVSGELSLTKMDRNGYQQLCAGQSDCVGDDGGHLIASSLGGAGDKINIVPQAATLNRGEWKTMENYLRDQLAAGKQVSVKIEVGYPALGEVRPNNFLVTATIDGKTKQFPFSQ